MSIEIKISKRPISYKTAIKFMENRVQSLKNGGTNELIWILEHPLIYTAGIRYQKNEIIDKSIKLIKVNRGGKITLHSPGQKIVYFVLNLNKRKKDIRALVSTIEKSIIEFLMLYKIKSKNDKKNIGIWIGKKKIAAIGIKVTKWIAYHGCSINVVNDLTYYKKISPCGLDNKNITSIKEVTKTFPKKVNLNLKNVFFKNLNKFGI